MKAGAMAFLSKGIHTCLVLWLKALIPEHIYLEPHWWPLWLPTTHQSVPLTPGTHPCPPHLLFVSSSSIMKGKDSEEVSYGMGLVVWVSDRIALTTKVASQMTSDPKLACLLGALEELLSWQRRRNQQRTEPEGTEKSEHKGSLRYKGRNMDWDHENVGSTPSPAH